MNRFYVTLPSNSSTEYYPDYTVACYTTKLVNMLELEGDWKVGLAEVSMPTAVENTVMGQCYYDIYMSGVFLRRIMLPSAHHKRVRAVIEDMHVQQRRQMGIADGEAMFISYNAGKK